MDQKEGKDVRGPGLQEGERRKGKVLQSCFNKFRLSGLIKMHSQALHLQIYHFQLCLLVETFPDPASSERVLPGGVCVGWLG